MEFKKDQGDIFKIFCEWEAKYPVDEWQVKGIDIWPVLKRTIYFALFRNPLPEREKENTFIKRGIKKIKGFVRAWLYLKFKKFKKSDFLFSGEYIQRIDYKGKKFNRYLEPILDYLEEKKLNSYLLEFGTIERHMVNKTDRVIDLNILLPLFYKKINKREYNDLFNALTGFQSLLAEVNFETGLKTSFVRRKLLKDLQSILGWAELYGTLIKKTEAKYLVGVVYYTKALYGMNLAARKLGAVSIDIQHGLQGKFHPGYYFNKVSPEGYNILPKYFWTWDKPSFDNIQRWSSQSLHEPILGGNPWISFIQDDDSYNLETKRKKPIILLTLQPLNPIISDHLLEVIQLTSKVYDWWLRFHPRMSKQEIEGVKQKLEEKAILKEVTLDKATNLPLPVALKICDLHISKCSGSIAEAAMMKVISLIISELGVVSYDYLIEKKIAYSCLSHDAEKLIEQIKILLGKPKSCYGEDDNSSFEPIIDFLLEK